MIRRRQLNSPISMFALTRGRPAASTSRLIARKTNQSVLKAILCLVPVTSLVHLVHGDDAPSPLQLDDRVAATVDGHPIYVRQVDREIMLAFKDRPIDPGAEDWIRAQTLAQLVNRRLILRYLETHDRGVTETELRRAETRVEKQLAAQDITLEQYLIAAGLTQDEFRDALHWQIGWRGYLARYFSDENLERYYNQHRRQFDGTRVGVAHILLELESTDDAAAWAAAEGRLREIRREILAGGLSFAEAARKYSQAATGKTGGQLGLIERYKPMPEGFSHAAFGLAEGAISGPVRSKFGAHLIQCTEIQSGDKAWSDVRRPLEVAVTKYLFDWVSQQQRPHARIEVMRGIPHFRPGTSELAD